MIVVVRGGQPRVAGRATPAGGGQRARARIYQPAERGHGYGSAVTAVATGEILGLGVIPLLFADLANPTSNRIYQQLGSYLTEDHLQVMFTINRSAPLRTSPGRGVPPVAGRSSTCAGTCPAVP